MFKPDSKEKNSTNCQFYEQEMQRFGVIAHCILLYYLIFMYKKKRNYLQALSIWNGSAGITISTSPFFLLSDVILLASSELFLM